MLNFNHLSDLIDVNGSFKPKCFRFMQDIFVLKIYFEWVKPLFRMQENISYLLVPSSGGAVGSGLGSSDLQKSALEDDFCFLPVQITTDSHLPQAGHSHILHSFRVILTAQGKCFPREHCWSFGLFLPMILVKTTAFNGWVSVEITNVSCISVTDEGFLSLGQAGRKLAHPIQGLNLQGLTLLSPPPLVCRGR